VIFVAENEKKETKLLFNQWDMSEVQINDPALVRYINLHSMIVPHSCGKFTRQEFNKANMLIVERLINRLMKSEKNTGKKTLAIGLLRMHSISSIRRPRRTRSRCLWKR